MKFRHLDVPNQWQHYWTKYPEGYTILEALLNWVRQVNELTDNVNDWNDYLNKFVETFDRELQGKVITTLKEWQDSGFLDVVIDEALQTQMDVLEEETNQKLNDFTKQLAQSPLYPTRHGAVGDGVTDDSVVFKELLTSPLIINGEIDLLGKTYLIPDSDITLNRPIKIKNGKLILQHSTINVPAGVNETLFENVTIDGFDRLKDGVFIQYPSMNHRFINCTFINCKRGLRTKADGDTQQNLFVMGCLFTGNEIGLDVKDLKRVTVTSNKFVANGIGFRSQTKDYQGIGMVFCNNYFNGNQEGALMEGGLYDTIIGNNIFDHNSMDAMNDGLDNNLGYGLKLIVPAGRHIRNVNIADNVARNNGDYSFIIKIEGSMTFCNITGNSAHLDDIANMKLDYSKCDSFSGNQFSSNHFINGEEIITNGTPLVTENAKWSPFGGGSVRGVTEFYSGVRFTPKTTLLFKNDEGYLQFYEGTEGPKGLYLVDKSGKHSLISTYQWTQTVDRPTNAPVGFMTFDTTLGKPIWRGLNNTWVDAMGNEV